MYHMIHTNIILLVIWIIACHSMSFNECIQYTVFKLLIPITNRYNTNYVHIDFKQTKRIVITMVVSLY